VVAREEERHFPPPPEMLRKAAGGKYFLRIKLEYVPNLGDSGRNGVLILAQDLSEMP
jgi:hypothetical protein